MLLHYSANALPHFSDLDKFAGIGERQRESSIDYQSHALDAYNMSQAPVHYITPPNSEPTKTYDDLLAQDEQDPRDYTLLPESSQQHTTPLITAASVAPFGQRQPDATPPRPIEAPLLEPGSGIYADARFKYDADMVRAVEGHKAARHHDKFWHSPKARGVSPPLMEDAALMYRFAQKMRERWVGTLAAESHARVTKRKLASMSTPPASPQPARRTYSLARSRQAPAPSEEPALADGDESDWDEERVVVPVTPSPRNRRRSSAANGSATRRRHSSHKRIEGSKDAKSARAKSSKVQKSDNYLDYPDFAPPLQTINRPMEPVRIEKPYTSNKADFTSDPERHLLCAEELEFAQSINLSCRKYACVKRQLFEEYVKWLRGESEHKGNWNKTRAQHMSNIDVTKTSLVFEFFTKAGWFERRLFEDMDLLDPQLDLSSQYYKGPGAGQ